MQEGSRIEALLNKCHSCCPPSCGSLACGRLGIINDCMSFLQKSEAKLDEILKEIKSLRELVSSQEKRIIKLEDQISKIGI